MDKVCVDVLLTEQDVLNYQKAIIKKAPLAFIIILGLFLTVGGIVKLITGQASVEIVEDQTLLIPSIAQVVFGAILLIIPFTMRRAMLKSYKTNKLLQKTQSYEISNEGIHITSEFTNSTIKWSELYKAKDLKQNYLLYLSKQQAYVLPKRCFSSTEELHFMQEVIKLAPVPKERKGIWRVFRWGLVFYIILFVIILFILFLYQR